ncbi:hypothetical protein EDB92DRAFT_1952230 [Lactarius akahatsu]|uniref:Uncharacterized protein n=1 Tax=Lactarius akahatsu TaxID=416441 RepID=A0AAD4Q6K7_9AGAM|nr:hypothetical protein EDB92DRAFT_1952230 [Lactarius akahatsu]
MPMIALLANAVLSKIRRISQSSRSPTDLRVDELAAVLTFGPDGIEGEVPTLDADSSWRSEEQECELLRVSACPSLITVVDSHVKICESCVINTHVLLKVAHTTLAQGSFDLLLHLDDRVDTRDASSNSWGDSWSRWSPIRTILSVGHAAEHWVSHAQAGSVSSSVTISALALKNCQTLILFRGFCDLVEHLTKKHSQHVNDFGGEHSHPRPRGLRRGGRLSGVLFLFLDVFGHQEGEEGEEEQELAADDPDRD